MGLRDWIMDSERVATATPATFATLTTKNKQTVATVATVAVASSDKGEIINLLEKGTRSVSTLPDESETTTPKLGALKISDDRSKQSSQTHSPKRGNRISEVALAWLLVHREALRRNGWTMAELYRRNKGTSIAWVDFWDRDFLKVYLHEDGIIEFEAVNAIGRDIIQTARPLSSWPKI